MSKLDSIEGIGPALSEKFASAGVATAEALLELGGSKGGRANLAEKTGLSELRILKLVNHADLMRIKGIGGEYSELLEAAGVDSVPELAQRSATALAAKIAEINATKKLVRVVPSEAKVSDWIRQARELPRAVSH